MKQKPAIILLWLLLLQATPAIEAYSDLPPEGWRALRNDLHINEKTVTRLDADTLSAWIYLIPQKGSDSFRAAEQQLKAMNKNSSDLEYIGYLSEIDCRRSHHRKLTTVYYKNDRNIIASRHRSDAVWKKIEDNSIFHELYLSVCKKD